MRENTYVRVCIFVAHHFLYFPQTPTLSAPHSRATIVSRHCCLRHCCVCIVVPPSIVVCPAHGVLCYVSSSCHCVTEVSRKNCILRSVFKNCCLLVHFDRDITQWLFTPSRAIDLEYDYDNNFNLHISVRKRTDGRTNGQKKRTLKNSKNVQGVVCQWIQARDIDLISDISKSVHFRIKLTAVLQYSCNTKL